MLKTPQAMEKKPTETFKEMFTQKNKVAQKKSAVKCGGEVLKCGGLRE